MAVVQRGERLINVENFTDNLVYAKRFEARGVLVEVSERGFFILKKVDPARFLIFFVFCPDLPDKPWFLIDGLGSSTS